MNLNFGHWEIFKLLVTALRDIEKNPLARSYFDAQLDGQESFAMSSSFRQKSTMEKQVINERKLYLQIPTKNFFQLTLI